MKKSIYTLSLLSTLLCTPMMQASQAPLPHQKDPYEQTLDEMNSQFIESCNKYGYTTSDAHAQIRTKVLQIARTQKPEDIQAFYTDVIGTNRLQSFAAISGAQLTPAAPVANPSVPAVQPKSAPRKPTTPPKVATPRVGYTKSDTSWQKGAKSILRSKEITPEGLANRMSQTVDVDYNKAEFSSYLNTIPPEDLSHFSDNILTSKTKAEQFLHNQVSIFKNMEPFEGTLEGKKLFSFWAAHHFSDKNLSVDVLKAIYTLPSETRALVQQNIGTVIRCETTQGPITPAIVTLLSCRFEHFARSAPPTIKTPIGLVWNHKGDQDALCRAISTTFQNTKIPTLFVELMSCFEAANQMLFCTRAQDLIQMGSESLLLKSLTVLKEIDFQEKDLEKLSCILKPLAFVLAKSQDAEKPKRFITNLLSKDLVSLQSMDKVWPASVRPDMTIVQLEQAINLCQTYRVSTQELAEAAFEGVVVQGADPVGEVLQWTNPEEIRAQRLGGRSLYKSLGGQQEIDASYAVQIWKARDVLKLASAYVARQDTRGHLSEPMIEFLISEINPTYLERLNQGLPKPSECKVWYYDYENFLTLLLLAPQEALTSPESVHKMVTFLSQIKKYKTLNLAEKLNQLTPVARKVAINVLWAEVEQNAHPEQQGLFDIVLNLVNKAGIQKADELKTLTQVFLKVGQIQESDCIGLKLELKHMDSLVRKFVFRNLERVASRFFKQHQSTYNVSFVNPFYYSCDVPSLMLGLSLVDPTLPEEALEKVLTALVTISQSQPHGLIHHYDHLLYSHGRPSHIMEVLVPALCSQVRIDNSEIETDTYVSLVKCLKEARVIVRTGDVSMSRLLQSISQRCDLHRLNQILLPLVQVEPDAYKGLLKSALVMLENDSTVEEIQESAQYLQLLSNRVKDELDPKHPLKLRKDQEQYCRDQTAVDHHLASNKYLSFHRLILNEIGLRPVKVMRQASENVPLAVAAFECLLQGRAVTAESRWHDAGDFANLLTRKPERLQNIPGLVDFGRNKFFGGKASDHLAQLVLSLPSRERCEMLYPKLEGAMKGINKPMHKALLFFTCSALPAVVLDEACDVYNKPEAIAGINALPNEPTFAEFLTFLYDRTDWDFPKLKELWKTALESADSEQVEEIYHYLVALMENQVQGNDLDDLYQALAGAEIRLEQKDYRASPFSVYEHLKVRRSEPVVFKPTPVEVLSEQRICLDPIYFENKLTAQIFRVQQLPNFNCFLFFNDQVARLNKLSSGKETCRQFELEVQACIGEPWSNFTGAVLGSNQLRDYTDFRKFDQTKPVPMVRAFFCQILAFVHDQSRDATDGKLLSPQNETFLKWMYGVANCKPGKDEGVKNMYANLEPQYKLKSQSNEVLSVHPCVELMHSHLLNTMEGFISGTHDRGFVATLCGLQRGAQIEMVPHQRIYIRNLIPCLGPLAFDIHTRVLYEALLQRSRSDVMNELFTRFTPSLLIPRTTTFLNGELEKPNSNTYKVVSEYLGDNSVWEFDTDTGKTRITEDGTINLLKKMGVVQELKDEDPQ